MTVPERYCDCPDCPCNVPIVGRQRECLECFRGNHMDKRTAKRPRPEQATHS